MSTGKQLTPQQEKFAREYLIDRNATQAAIRAGYSPKTARQQGQRLLSHVALQQVVQQAAHKAAKQVSKSISGLEVSVERILKERARLAFFDPRKMFDEHGQPLPVASLDDDTAACIAGYELDPEKFTTKVKLASKDASLTALEKHLGMYSDNEKGNAVLNIFIHA